MFVLPNTGGAILAHVPRIFTVSAVLAVIANSSLAGEKVKGDINICIACLAALSVFWQSFMKQLDYGGKAMLHESCADTLGDIKKTAGLKRSEIDLLELSGALGLGKQNADSSKPVGATDEEVGATPLDSLEHGNDNEDSANHGMSEFGKQYQQALQGKQ